MSDEWIVIALIKPTTVPIFDPFGKMKFDRPENMRFFCCKDCLRSWADEGNIT